MLFCSELFARFRSLRVVFLFILQNAVTHLERLADVTSAVFNYSIPVSEAKEDFVFRYV